MKNRKVVSTRNLPFKSPLMPTLVWWLVMDKLDAPGWMWGVLGTLLGILWGVYVMCLFSNEKVDLFK